MPGYTSQLFSEEFINLYYALRQLGVKPHLAEALASAEFFIVNYHNFLRVLHSRFVDIQDLDQAQLNKLYDAYKRSRGITPSKTPSFYPFRDDYDVEYLALSSELDKAAFTAVIGIAELCLTGDDVNMFLGPYLPNLNTSTPKLVIMDEAARIVNQIIQTKKPSEPYTPREIKTVLDEINATIDRITNSVTKRLKGETK